MATDWEKNYSFMRGLSHGMEHDFLKSALLLAKEEHKGQFRSAKKGDEKEPYISHPLIVSLYLLSLNQNGEILLTVAILHDIIEDTNITFSDLSKKFGSVIAEKVLILSKEKGLTEEELSLYYAEILKDRITLLVKLSDRCHNISTMVGAFNDVKIKKYIEETKAHILPMAKKAKDMYPDLSNCIVAMRYQIESIIKFAEMYLEKQEEKNKIEKD